MLQSQLFTYGDLVNKESSNDDFAQFLKRVMYDKGINQTTLARMSDLTPGAISNIIRGKRQRPDSDTCHKLATGLQKVGWQGEANDLLRMAGHIDAITETGHEADFVTIKGLLEGMTIEERKLVIDFTRLLLRRK